MLVTALDKGMPPYFRIDSSSPAAIPSKPKPWMVDNSEGAGRGMMTLQAATVASVNTVFARVAWELGIKEVAETAKRMGIKTKLPNYPSIALGAANVSPYEMASAYGTLATEGVRRDPICITKVVDRDDKTIFVAKTHGKRVVKASVAKAAIDIMKGVITGGTATRARIGRPAAGKTGTSQLNRDVWFVGFTPQLVTAVWVGLPQGAHDLRERVARIRRHRVRADLGLVHAQSTRGRAGARLPEPAQAHVQPVEVPHPGQPPAERQGPVARERQQAKLGGYGFTVEYVWSNKPKGTVVGQSSKNGKIVLIVSKGKNPAVKPPPVVGGAASRRRRRQWRGHADALDPAHNFTGDDRRATRSGGPSRCCAMRPVRLRALDSDHAGRAVHGHVTERFDPVEHEVHAEHVARDVAGDDEVELELLGVLPVLLGVVHADERADAGRRETVERFLRTLGTAGHVDDHAAGPRRARP